MAIARKPTIPQPVYAGKKGTPGEKLWRPVDLLSKESLAGMDKTPERSDHANDSDVILVEEPPQPAAVMFQSPIEVKVLYTNPAKREHSEVDNAQCEPERKQSRSVGTQTEERYAELVQEHSVTEIKYPDGRVEQVDSWKFFHIPKK